MYVCVHTWTKVTTKTVVHVVFVILKIVKEQRTVYYVCTSKKAKTKMNGIIFRERENEKVYINRTALFSKHKSFLYLLCPQKFLNHSTRIE